MTATDLVVPTTEAVADGATRARRRRALRVGTRLWSVVGVVGVAGLWEAVTRSGLIAPNLMPSFSATCVKLAALVLDTSFWAYVVLTLRAWAIGLVVAVAIALPAGFLIGLSDRAYRFVRVPVEAIRPVPPIVVLPLALLVLGGGTAFQTTLIVQGAMWPLLITVAYAVRSVDPVALDTAASFRLSPRHTLFFVRLPAAAPLIATGLRLGAATAFGVTIVSELLGGSTGLGTLLMIGQSGGDVALVYAVTLVAGVFGLVIAQLFGTLERPLLAWKVSA